MFLARRSLTPAAMATGMLLIITVASPATLKGDTIPLVEVGRDTPTTAFRDPVGTHLYKVAFAPGDKLVAVGCYEQPVRLLDVATGREMRRLNHQSAHGLTFSPDGKYLATADYYHNPYQISLWDPATGASLHRVKMEANEEVKHIHFLSAFPDQAKAITDTLSQWRFRPYLRNGLPVEVETGIMFGRPLQSVNASASATTTTE